MFGGELSVEVSRFWLDTLSRFPLPAIEYAFDEYLGSERFFPRPVDITDRCQEYLDRNAGDRGGALAQMDELRRREAEGEKFFTLADFFTSVRASVESTESPGVSPMRARPSSSPPVAPMDVQQQFFREQIARANPSKAPAAPADVEQRFFRDSVAKAAAKKSAVL